jgi:AAA15 family ATPase/GTPase
MHLESLKYTQMENTPCEWNLEDCTFGKINLIVGKNATGKSRIIGAIKALADLFSFYPVLPFTDISNYLVKFDNNHKKTSYKLRYENKKITEELIVIGKKIMLKRGDNGKGKIRAAQLKRFMDFQVSDDKIAVSAKRDQIQHNFLEDWYNWGKDLRFYPFSTYLGKDHVLLGSSDEISSNEKINLRDPNQVVTIFKKGQEEFKDEFTNLVKSDMEKIDFKIENIKIDNQILTIPKINNSSLKGFIVKENNLECPIEQSAISQGMFRTLSLLIQWNYFNLSKNLPSCILIDDIGEGLDYDRASSLIKLLIEKIKETDTQLIMTTNDRFVMNNVPLEYWSVIQRSVNKSKIYNYRNSKEIFDKFNYTGLNNFDFFSSEYYIKKGE